MEEVNYCGRMDRFMKGIGEIIRRMEREGLFIVMVKYISDPE